MAVEISADEKMMLDMVRELAHDKVAPRAAEIDAKGEFPWDMKELLAKQDILAMPFPEEYGGLGSSELSILMTIEELSKSCATTALLLCVQQLGSLPILLAGNDEQKQRFIPRLATGEWLAAFALTEPGSGSDAGAMRTRAERRGDTWVLNGLKHFITNAGIAHINTVFAITEDEHGKRSTSLFVVEADRPGFRMGKIENKMGIRGSQTGELVFEDCVIPAENLIGKVGDGFKIALATLDRTRPGIAAQALGIAQGALDFAVQYAKERVQFGKPIIENQAIQFMLADMDIKVEAARRLVYHVGELMDAGVSRFTRESAIAKTYASDIAMEVTNDALQILGGYGYMKEFPVERMMRDAKICQIYEGTNQIQRMVIARALTK
ncbi:MAG: Acyl-CoA dehydrogenase, short-chain specific [Ktedonobacterales bacterium]|jgi:alkylation response protein AidB-like acyl-CoA dehydrogenase|nr:MAG: Acyl-CoA dehydrogenase, short-chain specific [Ktedonobacterales bacterium]